MKHHIKIFAGLLVLAALFAGGCQLSVPGGVDQDLVATQSQFLIQAGRATQTAAAFHDPGGGIDRDCRAAYADRDAGANRWPHQHSRPHQSRRQKRQSFHRLRRSQHLLSFLHLRPCRPLLLLFPSLVTGLLLSLI